MTWASCLSLSWKLAFDILSVIRLKRVQKSLSISTPVRELVFWF